MKYLGHHLNDEASYNRMGDQIHEAMALEIRLDAETDVKMPLQGMLLDTLQWELEHRGKIK